MRNNTKDCHSLICQCKTGNYSIKVVYRQYSEKTYKNLPNSTLMHERQEIRLFIEEKETITYPVVLGWRIETVEDLSLDNFTKKLNERFMNKVNGIMIISALRKAYSEKKFMEFYQKLNGI